MTSRRWIHKLFTPGARRPIRKTFPRYRPALERLEDRTVPTTFTVNSSLDLVNPIFGVFTLRDAILAANNNPGADTIDFDSSLAGATITLNGTELPQITDSLTITGLGASQLTIDAHGQSRIFEISAGTTAAISGLTLTGGKAISSDGAPSLTYGGAILNHGTLTVDQCALNGNSALNGGGIGMYDAGAALTVTASVLSGNFTYGSGGAIVMVGDNDTLKVSGCTVSGNSVLDGGGGLSVFGGPVTISSSVISGNSAAANGGGIENEGNASVMTIDHTLIQGNSAMSGGGIYNFGSSTSVSSSFVQQNTAGIGGGIFNANWFTAIGTVVATGSVIKANTATTGSGGGIYNDSGIVTLSFGLIDSNVSVTGDGGGVFNRATLNLDSTWVTFNHAESGGGIENLGSLTATGTHHLYFHNSAIDGAGLFNGGVATIAGGDFDTNSAAFIGGAVRNTGTLSVTASTFGGNTAQSGGAIYNEGSLTVDGSTFTSNTATFGGGIYNSSVSQVTSSTLSGDSAAIEGGGILNNGGSTSMSDSFVQNNSAGIGGGIYNAKDSAGEGGTVSAIGLTIKANTATTGSGGGIYNDSGSVTLSGCFLDSNLTESGDGGGIFNRDTLTLNNTQVTFNFAESGGGIDNLGTLTSTGECLFYHNYSAIDGAGLFNGGAATIATDVFVTNTSAFIGGAVCNTGTLTLTACGFTENTAQTGGGIYNEHTLAIDGGNFEDNFSTNNGGAIANIDSGTLTLTNSSFFGNSAESSPDVAASGGGIYNTGSAAVGGSTFGANSTTGSGGAIANIGTGTLTLTNSRFAANTAQFGGAVDNESTASISGTSLIGNLAGHGGGIQNRGGSLTVDNCLVSGNFSSNGFPTINTSFAGGGILNTFGGIVSISRSTLSGNSATDFGGPYSTDGGAIDNENATITLSDSTITGNSARFGGGISNFGDLNSPGTVSLINCTLSGNAANADGGGIWNDDILRVTNSTIALNRADADGNGVGAGGGIWTNNGLDGTHSTTLNNTIVAGDVRGAPGANAPDDLSGIPVQTASAYNVIGDAATSGGLINGSNGNIVGVALAQVIDPVLKDNGGPTFTHALVADSPALNAGSNALAVDDQGNPLSTDQRGQPRIFAGTVDIGAFELQNARPTVADFTKIGAEDNPLHFTAADFTSHFSDSDGDALVKVRIVALPTNGTLKLGNVAVTAGQVIAAADLGKLVFVPALNFNGVTSFTYTASDGIAGFALAPATITLHIRSAFEQAADLKAMVDALVAAGVLSAGQGTSLDRKLNLDGNLPHDAALVGAFISQVNSYVGFGILTQSQANPLLDAANTLLISITTT
jgi:hypothetical protein